MTETEYLELLERQEQLNQELARMERETTEQAEKLAERARKLEELVNN